MAGREQKAREGKWNGGFAPYGYKLVEGGLEIADDAVEMILSEIREYQLPDKDEEIFAKLEKMLPTLDWDAMEALIKKKN